MCRQHSPVSVGSSPSSCLIYFSTIFWPPLSLCTSWLVLLLRAHLYNPFMFLTPPFSPPFVGPDVAAAGEPWVEDEDASEGLAPPDAPQ